MKEIAPITSDLLQTRGVAGVLVISREQGVVYRDFTSVRLGDVDDDKLQGVLECYDTVSELMNGLAEVDIRFDAYRIYMMAFSMGVLAVVMTIDAPAAEVRLQCGILAPRLEETAKGVIGSVFSRFRNKR